MRAHGRTDDVCLISGGRRPGPRGDLIRAPALLPGRESPSLTELPDSCLLLTRQVHIFAILDDAFRPQFVGFSSDLRTSLLRVLLRQVRVRS